MREKLMRQTPRRDPDAMTQVYTWVIDIEDTIMRQEVRVVTSKAIESEWCH